MLEKVLQNDLKAIQALIEQEFPYVKKPKEKLESKLNNPFFFLYKKTIENQLVGFIEFEVLGEKKEVRLNALAILPSFRNQGIGKQVLEEGIQKMQEKGFERIWLWVKQENQIARELYENQGFVWVRALPKKIDNAMVEEYKLEFEKEWHGVH
ncbi:GNAT family N-acetyltransferase [Candidatus Micrarchaeota archaeon]|nr:GNAT family N-acetyltransferase [Candidatus Micrarchaeota archaeon]MBU1930285.1 GNAT family N-acetyltransferase [Candidatus Micrarchaeota archaeon]